MALPDDCAADIFLPGGRLRPDVLHERSQRALAESLLYARSTRWDSVRSPHLFMGLLAVDDPVVRDWGERLGADLPGLIEQFRELFHQDEGESDAYLLLHREFLSDNVIRMLRDSYQRAAEHDRVAVSPMDLLISLFTTPQSIVAECFERIGVTAARLTELAVMAEQHAGRTT